MSYMYYSVIGSLVTIIVAMIVSLCTPSEEYNRKLLHPMISQTPELSPEKPNSNCINNNNKEVLNNVSVVLKSAIPEKF